MAGPLNDPGLELQAHHAAWATLIFYGDLAGSQEHVRRGLQIYDQEKHGTHALLYGGHDPAVCGTGQGGMALWMLGYPDKAADSVREGIALANDLAHLPSVGHALWFAGVVYMMRRDTTTVLDLGERLVGLSRERPQYKAIGGIMRGWARARSGDLEEGLAELRESIGIYRMTAAAMVRFFMVALADTELLSGHMDKACVALDYAVGAQRQELIWTSEILRATGDLRRAQKPGDLSAAEQLYHQAMSTARDHNAKSLELRAALALARLMCRQGRSQDAMGFLKPLYSGFTEGFATTDLQEAKAFLDQFA